MNSMTAFGRSVRDCERYTLTVELRSVNNRFLDCGVRLPRAYIALEEKIKEYVRSRGISRGKLEISVQVEAHGEQGRVFECDSALAASYIDALDAAKSELSLAGEVSVSDLARRTELFRVVAKSEDAEDADAAFYADLLPVLAEATDLFLARRRAEGENAMRDMKEKMEKTMAYAHEIAALSKTHIAEYRTQLEARLRELLRETPIDEYRVLNECALAADRLAIDEELARLESHKAAFDTYLASDECVGRSLDFLMQEFNRETNTIGSKASNARIAQLVVCMKNELEKIREQVQNVE